MKPALNPDQRAAVEALAGPVLIAAGAGSGKTRTLCERFVRATSDVEGESWRAAAIDEILAITFTDKAAGEIAERIRATLRVNGRREDALAVDGAWISTIHGLCSRLLRRYALEAGIDPGFAIAEDVLADRLRRAAFESVATEEMGTEEGRVLFETMAFRDVYAAVSRATTHALVLRTGLGALAVPRAMRPPREILLDAVRVFRQGVCDIAACGSDTKTAAGLQTCCEDLCEALDDIESDGGSDVEVARDLVEALGRWRGGRDAKAISDVRERLRGQHSDLHAEAIEALDALLERALVRLTGGYRARLAELKRARGVLDFDDLQSTLTELLERRPDVLERCRERFRLSMVDEFQDTDALQLALIERLALPNLCTVGDERQSIYHFRGADLAVYQDHVGRMRQDGARDFALDANYRSHPDVLMLINELFGHRLLFGEHYRASLPGREARHDERGPEVRVAIGVGDTSRCGRGASRTAEAAWVAARFAALSAEYSPREMAVLVRGYTHAEVYARALRAVGLEAAIVGGSRLFELPETHMVRALVRVIGNPHDEEALVTLLAGDAGRLTDDALFRIAHASPEASRRTGLWEALSAGDAGLADLDEVRAERLVAALEEARTSLGIVPLAHVVLRALERLDVDLLLLGRGPEGRQAFANILQLVRRIGVLEAQGVTGPSAVESHLSAMQALGAKATPAVLATEESEAVRIMSVHASKGLEFPIVAAAELDSYVRQIRPGIDVGPVPGNAKRIGFSVKPSCGEADVYDRTRYGRMREAALRAEADEAKRLFYVACTRAEDVLLLCGAAKLVSPAGPDDPQPLSALRQVVPEIDGVAPGDEAVVAVGAAVVGVEVLVEPDDACDDGDATGAATATADSGHELDRDRPGPVGNGALHRPPAPLRRISYSDLALHERCALRFHAQRVLRLGRPDYAGEASAADFGSAAHAALQLAVSGGELPGERLDALACAFGLGEDARHDLEGVVRRFVSSTVAQRLFAHDVVRPEWPFSVRLGDGDEWFDLAGSIDAFGRTGELGLVVDYKTGGRPDDQDLEQRYALQADCYAIAAAAAGCRRVRVEFVRLQVEGEGGEPERVAFDFDEARLAEARKEVCRRFAQVRGSARSPLTRWDQGVCGDCPAARTLCPVPGPTER